MTAGASKAGPRITPQPALAPSPQPRPAPTARALIVRNVGRRGPFWMPIWGPDRTPIDTRLGVSRVAYAFLVYMLSPLSRRSGWAYHSLIRPAVSAFPERVVGSACANQRLQPLRHLHDCSGCFRLERLPGGTYTHWKAPPFHGAHPKPT